MLKILYFHPFICFACDNGSACPFWRLLEQQITPLRNQIRSCEKEISEKNRVVEGL